MSSTRPVHGASPPRRFGKVSVILLEPAAIPPLETLQIQSSILLPFFSFFLFSSLHKTIAMKLLHSQNNYSVAYYILDGIASPAHLPAPRPELPTPPQPGPRARPSKSSGAPRRRAGLSIKHAHAAGERVGQGIHNPLPSSPPSPLPTPPPPSPRGAHRWSPGARC